MVCKRGLILVSNPKNSLIAGHKEINPRMLITEYNVLTTVLISQIFVIKKVHKPAYL